MPNSCRGRSARPCECRSAARLPLADSRRLYDLLQSRGAECPTCGSSSWAPPAAWAGCLCARSGKCPASAVAAALERAGSDALGKDAGAVAGLPPVGVPITDDPLQAVVNADGILDFTAPAASVELAALAAQARIVHVIGTTGLSPCRFEKDRRRRTSRGDRPLRQYESRGEPACRAGRARRRVRLGRTGTSKFWRCITR